MRLALLGTDDLSRQLVSAVEYSAEHSVIVLSGSETLPDSPQFRAPIAREEAWEAVIARRDIDAVVFAAEGRSPELRDEQLKRLAQEGIPLLVMHPACDVMLAYEVEMVRREAGGIVMPFAPDWWHPAFDRLEEWISETRTAGGEIEQVIFERSLMDSSRPAVLRQFSQDVWLIRRMVEQINSISAVGISEEDASAANLTVHCVGTNRSARWSIVPAGITQGSAITLVGSTNAATLRMPAVGSPWRLEVRGQQQLTESFQPWTPWRHSLERLQSALAGEPPSPSWSDVCVDLETVDSVQKSLRRKRAIDVHSTEASEDQTFKGFMAAAGCLILVVILLSFVFLAVFEGFRMPLRDTVVSPQPDPAQTADDRWPLWIRLWPVYPLIVFLLLQFLLLLAKRPPSQPDPGTESESSG